MDIQNGFYLAIGIAVVVLLVALLVSVFYKPGKRLHVDAKFSTVNKNVVEVHVKNVGKRKVKTVAPYVKFTHGRKTRKYQVNPVKLKCNFPHTMGVGEEVKCEIDLEQYHSVLKKKSMNPTHVKIIIENMVGMNFNSHTLNYKF
jgi:hypothetical protein